MNSPSIEIYSYIFNFFPQNLMQNPKIDAKKTFKNKVSLFLKNNPLDILTTQIPTHSIQNSIIHECAANQFWWFFRIFLEIIKENTETQNRIQDITSRKDNLEKNNILSICIILLPISK